MSQEPNYIEIREPGSGKLLCKYDPERQILAFQRRGIPTKIDLREVALQALAAQDEPRRQPS